MLAKINPLYLCIAAEFFGSSRSKNRSIIDDISAVSDLQGFSHIVIGYKNTDLLRFQMINDPLNFNHRNRVDARKRLVQENKFWRNNQRSCNLHSASFSSRECIREAFSNVRNSEFFEQIFKPFPPLPV